MQQQQYVSQQFWKKFFLDLSSGLPANVRLPPPPNDCKHKLVCMTKRGSLPTPILQGCKPSWKIVGPRQETSSCSSTADRGQQKAPNQHLGPVQLQGGEGGLPSVLRHKQILFSLAFATARKRMAEEIPQHRQQGIAESHHYTNSGRR